MKKIISTLALFVCLHSVAEPQDSSVNIDPNQKRHIETAECVAVYNYGQNLTKKNKQDHSITHKFKTIKNFLKKQLTLDVGDTNIAQVRKAGRNNVRAYLQENDHIYDLKHDGYETELLNLFKHYNTQCQMAIKYYQTHKNAQQ